MEPRILQQDSIAYNSLSVQDRREFAEYLRDSYFPLA